MCSYLRRLYTNSYDERVLSEIILVKQQQYSTIVLLRTIGNECGSLMEWGGGGLPHRTTEPLAKWRLVTWVSLYPKENLITYEILHIMIKTYARKIIGYNNCLNAIASLMSSEGSSKSMYIAPAHQDCKRVRVCEPQIYEVKSVNKGCSNRSRSRSYPNYSEKIKKKQGCAF